MADPGRLKIREGGVWRYAGVGMSGASGYSGAGSSASGYQKDFTYADLVSGNLPVNHGLSVKNNIVGIMDNNFQTILPDGVTFTDLNNLTVDLTSYGGISGTWNVAVTNGGGALGLSGYSGQSGQSGWSGVRGGGTQATFTQADLDASGNLQVNHNLHFLYENVQVYDETNKQVIPDGVTLEDADNLTVELASYAPITGTWGYLVTNGGGFSGAGLSGYSGYSSFSGYSGYSGMSGMTDGGMYLPFTNADISSGIMTVNHMLGTKYNSVGIYDENDNLVIPDNVTLVDTDSLDVDLTSYGTIVGTWYAVITNGGGALGLSGYSGQSGIRGGGMTDTFTQSDIDASGNLQVYHGLQYMYNAVTIYDDNNVRIMPDDVTLVDVDNLTVDLSSHLPIAGTWNIVVTNGGGGNYAGQSGWSGYSGNSGLSGYSGWSGTRGGGMTQTFTYADLVDSVLSVNYQQNLLPNNVTIISNEKKVIFPDEITLIDNNNVDVDLTSYGIIEGTWYIVVTNGGGVGTSGYSGYSSVSGYSGYSGYSGQSGIRGGGTWIAFDNSDVSSGLVTITHNLNFLYNTVMIFDENDKQVLPDDITLATLDTVTVDLTSFGIISGTWHAIVANGGGPSGFSGYSGYDAQAGYSGPSGYSGYSGPAGTVGSLIVEPEPSSDNTAEGIKISFQANENQAFGDVCQIDSTGQAAIANATVIATASAIVMCADSSISADASGSYLLHGIARDDAWGWTPGGIVFLSTAGTTGNTLTQTKPTSTDEVVQVIGVATHADRIYFNPSLVQVELL